MAPDGGSSKELARVCNNSAGQDVRVLPNEALLIDAEVCEELCILLEQHQACLIWSRLINLKQLFILEEATLVDEYLEELVHGEDHKLPLECIQDMALGIQDLVIGVPSLNHVVEGVSAWILDLMVLARDHQAHNGHQQGVIVSLLLRRVQVHQHHGVVDRLVLRTQAVRDVAKVVYSFHPFLYTRISIEKFKLVKIRYLTR
jgi:hypothetical protein